MPRLLKWLAGGVLAVVALVAVAAAIALVVLDGNDLKPYVADGISSTLGREVSIEGDLAIDPGLEPLVVAHNIKVADAPWAPRPYMAEIARLAIRFDLPALLRGNIAILRLEVDEPAVTLETAADGRRNWAFLTEDGDDEEAPLPAIEALRLQGLILTYIDGARGARTRATLDSARGSLAGPERSLQLQASGAVEDAPLRLSLSAEGLAGDGGQARPVQGEVSLARSRMVVDGSVTPREQGAPDVDLQLQIDGPDTSTLRSVLPAIPDWPAFHAETRVVGRGGDTWRFEEIAATLGESDIGGRVAIEPGDQRPRISAELQSRKIDLVQLAGHPTEEPGPVIPETPIDFGALRAFDADIRFTGRTVYVPPRISLEHMEVGVAVEGGALEVQPLTFQVGNGWVRTNTFRVEAGRDPVQTTTDMEIEQLDLGAALQELEVETEAFGTLNGRVELAGTGQSPAAILGSTNGSVELIMQQGRLDQLLVTLAGQDIPDILDALTGNEEGTIELRCMIADFEAQNGVLNTTTLLLDAGETQIIGGGDIDLGAQAVNLAILPRHKDFSPLAAQAPVHIEGGFKDIALTVDTAAAVASLITPFELPDTEDANCRELARAARQR